MRTLRRDANVAVVCGGLPDDVCDVNSSVVGDSSASRARRPVKSDGVALVSLPGPSDLPPGAHPGGMTTQGAGCGDPAIGRAGAPDPNRPREAPAPTVGQPTAVEVPAVVAPGVTAAGIRTAERREAPPVLRPAGVRIYTSTLPFTPAPTSQKPFFWPRRPLRRHAGGDHGGLGPTRPAMPHLAVGGVDE